MKFFQIMVIFLTLMTLRVAWSGELAGGGERQQENVPKRIISLGPINTENIYLLGAEGRLVANTSYCVRPEAAKGIEKIGSVMEVSIEKIISLKPDLVLATGLTRQQQVEKLKSIGLNVIRFPQPKTFEEMCQQFLRLGKLLGVEKRAADIVGEAREKVETIAGYYARFPKQKVFLQVGSRPLFSSVKGSFTNDFIRYAGGVNIAGERRRGSMNYEQVAAINPDVIIIAIMGSETGVAGTERKKWLGFNGLKAATDHRVHIIEPDLVCSPSPVTFAEALTSIAELIHL